MKIFVTGTRGIPDIAGGVEKHCQELYRRIASRGHDVFVSTRKPYVKKAEDNWNGVRLVHTYAPQRKSLEAVVHTFLSILKAGQYRPDIIHIHSVGPGLLTPVTKLLGYKVVVTNHGPDYRRDKWGRVAKSMLKLGEFLGCKWADTVIVISETIKKIIQKRCGKNPAIIYNGVNFPVKDAQSDYIARMGLKSGKYVLAVARFVPEKGLHLLMEAFCACACEDFKLVLAGDADHETPYSRCLKQKIAASERIVGTGYIMGKELNQLYSHAGLFVLPSFHEGLPIVLLEAMSFGIPVLVSDIPANTEVGLASASYFKSGNARDLEQKMSYWLENLDHYEADHRRVLACRYNWDDIATQTIAVYQKALSAR